MIRTHRRQWVGWAAGAASVATVLALAIFFALSREVDIDVYLLGGKDVFGPHLYDIPLPGTGLRFTYPPFAALVFSPLALLPTVVAQVFWSFLNVAALTALLFVGIRATRPYGERATALRWALILVLPAAALDPVHLTLTFGQVNLFVTLLVLADLTGERHVGTHRLPRRRPHRHRGGRQADAVGLRALLVPHEASAGGSQRGGDLPGLLGVHRSGRAEGGVDILD